MINAATFQPEKLTLDKPERKKRENFSFVTVPLRYDEKPALLKIKSRLKIFKHDSNGNVNFSDGITPESTELLQAIEKRIRSLASAASKEIKKVDPRKVLNVESFCILKTDKSEKQKVFGKLISKDGEIAVPFLSVERDENGSRKEIDPGELINIPLKGMAILNFSRVFIGTVSSITVNVKEVLIKEIARPKSLFETSGKTSRKEKRKIRRKKR